MISSQPTTRFLDQLAELATADRSAATDNPNRLPARIPKHNPLNSPELTLTRSWFALGAAATLLGGLGMRQFGWSAAAGIAGLGAASLAYMTEFEPAHPTLEHVTLRLPSLPCELDGLRIGQITDSHLGKRHTARNLAWAVEQMAHEQPELLVLTGDMISHYTHIPELVPLLGRLRAPLGIYAVPGNHDYWEGLDDLNSAFMLAGISLLMNEHRRLRWNGVDFWLAGVDDIWDGHADFATARAGVPDAGFMVLLAHSPDVADQAAEHGFALQLSGHTHGGHLRLPGLGALAHPPFGVRYDMGHYQVGPMQLYVSRGLGGTALRLLCRPEATILTLRCG